MDEFEKEVKSIFLEEAVQLATDLEQAFLSLEAEPTNQPTLDEIFRIAHNLKGSSKAVGFDKMGSYLHEFESAILMVFKSDKDSGGSVQSAITFFLASIDSLSNMIEQLREDLEADVDTADATAKLQQFTDLWKQGADFGGSDSIENLDLSDSVKIESIKVVGEVEDVSSLDPDSDLSLPSEGSAYDEIIFRKNIDDVNISPASVAIGSGVSAKDPSTRSQNPPSATANKKSGSDETIRVSLERLENLINYVGEIVILHTVLEDQLERGNLLVIQKMLSQLGKVTKDVQDLSMGLRMVPLKNNFQKMQRIVRDTAKILDKEVVLDMHGEETELDKTVLDALNDPLTHLVRNAVDHGIESPAVRRASGKSAKGKVELAAFHRSGKMVIEIRDDGGGINIDKLHEKAYTKGILQPGVRLPDSEARDLIFHPGFSTKDLVSEVSGRGVGMDVVRTNIEALQGIVEVESTVGEGSCFRIILPLTLAIIDGMIIKSGKERFVVPLSHVHESVNPTASDIKVNSGMGEILLLRDENIPLYRLRQLLNQRTEETADLGTAIVIRNQNKVFAVMVDDIVGQHQVVIKKLGKELSALCGYLGSAILGDGKPSLILELPELVDKHGQRAITSRQGRVAI